MFGNRYYGEGDDLLLGNRGTIHRDANQCVSYLPERKKQTEAIHPTPTTSDSNLTDLHTQNFFRLCPQPAGAELSF
jgi:hypothetical protein